METITEDQVETCYTIKEIYNWLWFAHKQGLDIPILLEMIQYGDRIPKLPN